jgi:1-acyl-sn-glycerol-3-phosphate acyltransferase
VAVTDAPGRGTVFEVDPRLSGFYRFARAVIRGFVHLWFRPVVIGRSNVPESGPVVLTPVHRSFADFLFAALVTDRKLFFMAKDELWRSKPLGKLLLVLGAFPVHRESADREALQRAEQVLRQGQLLVMFPEGTRQAGPEVRPLQEGATFLAARSGAALVPMGIGGSDRAMPVGSRIPRPLPVTLVVGEAMAAPARSEGGRVSRSRVHDATDELRGRIQQVYDVARS